MMETPDSDATAATIDRATIKDVSRLAGVSIKTVSRVLNNERYVREDTRRRVQEVIAALNFHPSSAARSLAGRRSHQVALVCDNPSPYYLQEVLSGVRARCDEDKVRVVVQPYDRGSAALVREINALVDQVEPDGLILTPPLTDNEEVLEELARRGIPFVRISPGSRLDLAGSSFIENEAAACEMTRYLAGLGHVRIGFVMGHRDYATSRQRMSGYMRGLAEAGIGIDLALVRQGDYDFASGSEAAIALLALADPPTAIFASSDDMAAGVLAAAHRLGIAVPARLSVAGFDDTALAEVVWPPLTTVRQPTRELAYAATDLLLGGGAPERRRIAHAIIVRESTAAPGGS